MKIKRILALVLTAIMLLPACAALAKTMYVKTPDGKPVQATRDVGPENASGLHFYIPYGAEVTTGYDEFGGTWVTYKRQYSGFVYYRFLSDTKPTEEDRAEALGLVIAPPAAPNSLGNGEITATACSASVQTATAKGKGDGEKHERLSFNGSEDNLLFTAYTFKKKSLKGWRVNGVTVKGAKHSSTLWLKKVDRDVNVEAVYQLPEAADSSVSCTVTARNAYIQRMTSKEKATGSKMEELQLSKSENLIITAKVPKGKRITGWSVNGQIIQFSNTSKTLKLFGVDCDVEVEPIFA